MSYNVDGMLDVRQLETPQATHEDLFLQLYYDLLSWAMYLTDRQRERAEDLVHDSFIQFTRTRPDLATIKDIRSYLFRVVRNMHLSHLRRWLQPSYAALSISDFDSAEAGLRTVALETDQAARQLQDVKLRVLSDLRHVCHYACARKEISKAGSVMILRFFHGYYPSEICKVMRTTRKAVEEWLRIARREVKAHQSDPLRLRFMAWNSEVDVPSLQPTLSVDEIVAELRAAVFHTRHGDCLGSEQLARLYKTESDAAVECSVLAHIVSCAACLDRVNELLGIEPLSERCPIEKLGRDRGSTSARPQQDGVEEFKRKNARRAREYDEHRPHELRIAVNGHVLGAQRVVYDQNEQVVTVSLNEPMSFVEVLSEQDVRLLYLDAASLPGDGWQPQRVELSDGRTLGVTFSFGDVWPTLRVTYDDPSLCPSLAAGLNEEVRSRLEALRPAPRRTSPAPAFSILNYDRPSIKGPWPLTRFFSPAGLTAVLALALIAALLWAYRPAPPISADALLERAIRAEDLVVGSRDEAVNQVVTLEERDPADGRVLARRRIETWRRGSDGKAARRLYDEERGLIGGAWTDRDGTRKVYLKGARAEEQRGYELGELLANDQLWQLDLSAGSFASIIAAGRAHDANVRETPSSYLISYDLGAGLADREVPRLLRATLTLNRSDLHATEQTLLVQGYGRRPAAEVREYRFVEASYRRRSIAAVPSSAFEPEPELTGLAVPRRRPTEIEGPAPPATAAATEAELTSLEMEARYLLDRVGASLGEQITFARTADGRVRIEALVDTDQRKADLRRALEPLANNAAIVMDLATVAEATQRAGGHAPSGPLVVTRFELGASEMPAYQDLKRHFRESLGNGASEAEVERCVQQFATNMQTRADQPMRHAWALKRLVDRFSQSQLDAMDGPALEQWRLMISKHAREVQLETEKLRLALEPVFGGGFGNEKPGEIGPGEIRASGDRRTEEVVRSVRLLFELVSATERVVSKAFSHSVDNRPPAASMKAEQFWRSLRRAESLAERLHLLTL